jgi:hypothetical protein
MSSRYVVRASDPGAHAHASLCPGITLVKADDFETWYFTIEVMGESLYKVRLSCPAPHFLLSLIGGTGRGIYAQIQIRASIPHIITCRPVRGRRAAAVPCSPGTSNIRILFVTSASPRLSMPSTNARVSLRSTFTPMDMYVHTCLPVLESTYLCPDTIDLRVYPWQRVVSGSKRYRRVRNAPEHVSVLQGTTCMPCLSCCSCSLYASFFRAEEGTVCGFFIRCADADRISQTAGQRPLRAVCTRQSQEGDCVSPLGRLSGTDCLHSRLSSTTTVCFPRCDV